MQQKHSVTVPGLGITFSTGVFPSTRTIVPMPIGASMAVQKWNSCGVFGFFSVATTRPTVLALDAVSVRDANVVQIYDTLTFAKIGEIPAQSPSGIFFTARAHRNGL